VAAEVDRGAPEVPAIGAAAAVEGRADETDDHDLPYLHIAYFRWTYTSCRLRGGFAGIFWPSWLVLSVLI
jgi:hypothetical protein